MAALVASRHNPILKPLYLRLLSRGKAKKLALTALMRKLIVLTNNLLKKPDLLLLPKTVADPLRSLKANLRRGHTYADKVIDSLAAGAARCGL